MRRQILFSKGGVSLVEVVVGAAILLLALSGLVTAYGVYLKAGLQGTEELQAAYLLEEGLEALRALRDAGFTSNVAALAAGTTYYLSWNGSRFVSTTTKEVIGGTFTRSFLPSPVYRAADQNIAESGALDPAIRKITVSVSWQGKNGTTTKFLSTYLTDLFSN